MTDKEAVAVINILKSADGGCAFCVNELFDKFIEKFPEWKHLVVKLPEPIQEELMGN